MNKLKRQENGSDGLGPVYHLVEKDDSVYCGIIINNNLTDSCVPPEAATCQECLQNKIEDELT